MSTETPDLTIHTRKYFRVVLDGIDPALETPDSFAIKLTVKTRTVLRRARHVAHNVPYVVKSGLDASRANYLKSLLEEIGGIVRLESHFVTPGEDDRPPERREARPAPTTAGTNSVHCPACGWEEPAGARFCSMCHRKFRDPNRGADSLLKRLPETNPLLIRRQTTRPDPLREVWARYKLPIIIGGAIILIFILLK